MDHLDYDAVNSLKEVMGEDFSLLIETFIQDSHERIEKLQLIIGGDDSDNIRRCAHSFKGSCSNIGAYQLTRFCAEMEAKALAGDLQNLNADLLQIQQEFGRVRVLLLELLP